MGGAAKRQAASSTKSFRAEITENSPVCDGFMLLGLRPTSGKPPAPAPGQFYMVSAGNFPEPLLKRPFCYFDSIKGKGGFQILYKVQGKGTRALAAMSPGAGLEVLGPLGNTYPNLPKGKKALIIAGGIGIASVMPLIEKFKDRAVVLLGARSKEQLLMSDRVKDALCTLKTVTDDGSHGARGTALDLLREMAPGPEYVIYACGPEVMISAVAWYAQEHGLKGYASMEAYMACGIGACMGCVVSTKQGYRRVCKDGPVFKLEDLLL